MEEIIGVFALNKIGGAMLWRTANSVSGFYMQRLHYENPHMRGSVVAGPQLLSAAAHLMAWCAYGLAVYVGFRVGWIAALAFVLLPIFLAMIIENLELFLLRVPTPTMALINTPIALVSFVMLFWSIWSL